MEIHEEKKGAVTVIKPAGPIIQADAEVLKQRVIEVRKASLGRLVVDLAGVPYVDSRGLEALVDVNAELSRGGQSLKICGVNETVREVLDVTELAGLFEPFEDASAAVRSFL